MAGPAEKLPYSARAAQALFCLLISVGTVLAPSAAWAAPPAVGTITPASGSSAPDQWVSFTATYTDPNGWKNLKEVRLLVNTSTSGKNSLYVRYVRSSNKLYLRDDANRKWLGGFSPGTATVLMNSQGQLDVAGTTASGSGNVLMVTWKVAFKSTFAGRTYNTYLWAKDNSKSTGFVQRGTWTVTLPDSTPPTTPVVTDDGAFTSSTIQLHASWSASDPESGIVEYQYQVTQGSPTGTVVVPWTSTGTTPSVTQTGLSLTNGASYYFSVKARNGANLWSSVGSSDGITVDSTPPTTPSVTDDGAFTSSLTQLHATWTASDPESGIVEYQYQITQGSSTGTVVVAWTTTGTTASVTKTGLSLTNGASYYFSVKARNGANLWSSVGVSDGIVVDSTAATTPIVTDDGTSTSSTTQLHATWTASDPESGIAEYQYQITQGSSTGTVVVPWTSTGTTASVTRMGLSLVNGASYYFSVKARNGANLWSSVGVSDGITVAGGTTVSGSITTNTTWTLANSPYRVASSVTVLNGATLTIQPGVEVRFDANTSLNIGSSSPGALMAQGTASSPILFTSNQTVKTPGFWGGIVFNITALGTSLMEYCTVEYGGGSGSGNPYLIRTFFVSPTLRNLTLRQSGKDGVWITNASPTIQDTTIQNVAGYGVQISGTSAPILQRLTVVNPGNYGVYVTSSATSGGQLTNSTIANGVTFTGPTTMQVMNNTFTNYNAFPTQIGANSVGSFLANNSFQGVVPGSSRLDVLGEVITQSATWPNKGIFYVMLGGASVYGAANPVLTLSPGIELRFGASASLRIGAASPSSGALMAQGTATSPILFTSNQTVKTAGFWSGIQFYYDSALISLMEYCTVEYGGGSGYPLIYTYLASPTLRNLTLQKSGKEGLVIYGGSPTVQDTTIQNVAGYGAQIGAPGGQLTNSTIANGITFTGPTTMQVTGNTFTNYDSFPTQIGANSVGSFLANNSFQGVVPGSSHLDVLGEVITQSATWPNKGIFYVMLGGASVYGAANPVLTLSPGIELRFNANASLRIGAASPSSGALMAQGTATSPILFTSNQTVKTAGFWSGIQFYYDSALISLMEYCTVEYGGGSGYPLIYTYLASPTLRNMTLRQSGRDGLTIYNGQPIVEHNTIVGNRQGIVVIDTLGYEGRIRYNNIAGNTAGGLANSDSRGVAARLNWWGNASGPSGIGLGSGDAVTGNVLFEPWLAQPSTQPFKWVEALSSPNSVTQAGGWSTFSGTLPEPGNWTITLKNSTGSVVRSFTGTAISFTQDWFGDDATAAPLPNGTYTYQLDATSLSTGQAAAPAIGRVTLDNALPIANITSPTPNQMLAGGVIINITGSAGGANFSSYKVEYGPGPSPTSWFSIASGTTPVTKGLLATWNTTGLTAPSYTLRLTVTRTTGQTATELVTIRMLALYSLADSPDPFSPNGDGVRDTTTFTAALTFPSDWTLTLKDSASTIVKIFTGTGTAISQIWDGTDTNGVRVPDGIYTYQLQGTDSASGITITSATGQVTVDVTPPTAIITSPSQDQVIPTDDPLSFIGTANDTNFSDYSFAYGVGPSPSSFTTLFNSYYKVTNGNLFTLDFYQLLWSLQLQFPPGTYTFRLTVRDQAGNVSVFDRRIILDQIYITNVSVNPFIIDPYNGEIAGIQLTLNRPADATLQIYDDLSKQSVRTLTLPGLPAGVNTASWDGKNSTGTIAPLEAYYFTIKTTDASGRKGSYNDAASPLVGPAFSLSNSKINSTNFDPYKNDLVQISYDFIGQGRLTLQIFDARYSPIRTIFNPVVRTSGSYVEFWDGRRDDGNLYQGTFSASLLTISPNISLNSIVLSRSSIDFINFRAEAYLIQPLFGEVSTLTYTLTQDATVSMTITDPNGNAVRTLLSNTLQKAGLQSIEWDGRTDTGKLVSVEGDYTVTLTAVDPTSGLSYKRLGSILVYK